MTATIAAGIRLGMRADPKGGGIFGIRRLYRYAVGDFFGENGITRKVARRAGLGRIGRAVDNKRGSGLPLEILR